MRYLIDRVALAGTEFRVIANTDSPLVEVWGDQVAYEFADRATALSYLAQAYKTAQDLRNLMPGQEVVLDMADGSARTVSVINNDPNQVTVVDSKSGESMQIPHLQNTGSPRVLPQGKPANPAQSGMEGGPEPGEGEGGESKSIEPGTGTVLSKKKSKPSSTPWWKQHEEWEKKHPNRKRLREVTVHPDKTREEKWAAVDPTLLTKQPKHDLGGLVTKPKRPGDLSQLNITRPNPKKPLSRRQAAWSPFDEAPVFPEGKPKVEYRPYRCMNCGHEQMIQTNHLGRVSDYCKNCSWKPSFGNPEYQVAGPGGRTYRPFEYAGPSDRTVLQSRQVQADYPHRHPQHCKHDGNYLQRKDPSDAEKECPSCGMVYAASRACSHCNGTGTVYRRKTTLGKGRGERCRNCGGSGKLEDRAALSKRALTKIAQPPALSGQPESSQPAQQSMPTGPQQAPAQEQADPQNTSPSGKRPLSRHEIITEAEILIRNALYKGVKIGTMDLVKYMEEQYGNTPEELYEGATKAWEKVQWEEEEAFQVAKGPGPDQKNQPGLGGPDNPALEGDEAPNPIAPEQVARLPKNGPTQVKV